MNYYKITSILHTGIDGERYTSRTDGRYPNRIGRIVTINEKEIKIEKPFYLQYVTDEKGNDLRGFVKRTSYVVDWDFIFDDKLTLETHRSIYMFEKVDEVNFKCD